MRWIAAAVFAALLAGCSPTTHVREGDRKFESRDFDGAVASYSKAVADDPDDADLAARLEAARKNAAIVRGDRAARAAEEGDLARAQEEIARACALAPAEPRFSADRERLAALRARLAADLENARTARPVEAVALLAPVEKYARTFPEVTARLAQARASSVQELLAAAESFGKAGEWAKSEQAILHAQEIAVKDAPLLERVKASRTNLRVLELVDQAYALKAQDDLEGALSRFTTAVELRPDAEEAVRGLASTRVALSVQTVNRALEARNAGSPLEAWALLSRALALDPESREAGVVLPGLRRDAVAALLKKAAEAEKRGLAGLEWLRASQAKAVAPDDPAAAKALKEAGTRLDRAMRPVILVKSFRNATGSAGREVRLASETYRLLREAGRNGKLATILDEDSYAIHLKENREFTPDLIVKATLERFDLMHHPTRSQARSQQYDRRVSFLDVTGKVYIEGTERDTYNYQETTKRVEGAAILSYEIYDVTGRVVLGEDTVRADFDRSDTIVYGNEEAGVKDDPDEMPADGALADELQGQLKDRLLERMRAELGWVGRHTYTAYERARDVGDVDAAVSWAVVAIRGLQAAERPIVNADVEYVLRRTGWSLSEGKLVPEQLK